MQLPLWPESNTSSVIKKKAKLDLTQMPRIFKSGKSYLINANSTGLILKSLNILKKEKNCITKVLAKSRMMTRKNLSLPHNHKLKKKPRRIKQKPLTMKVLPKRRKKRKTKRKTLKELFYLNKNLFLNLCLESKKKLNKKRINKKPL
jgi:hypothetical protein